MEKKGGIGAFLKKTFELKKQNDDPEKKETDTKKSTAADKKTTVKTNQKAAKTAKPAAKTTSKATTSKAAPKISPKTAPPAKKTAAKTSPKTTKTAKPTSKPTSKTAASNTAASKAAVSKPPVTFSKNMTKADNIRFYIYQHYFKPAKIKGQNKITLLAGDIHKEMGLKAEVPAVCSAMKTRIDRLYDVEILDVKPENCSNSKLTVKYDLKNLYMEEGIAPDSKTSQNKKTISQNSEAGYSVLKELEEKLRHFVSSRVESRFGKEWWKGTDMGFLADRWNERRLMNERTNADKKGAGKEPLISYASFSDYRRIINNPFAWDAFEEYFPDRGWIIQRLKELDPIRNAIMHHMPLEEDDYVRLNLYSKDILKIIDKSVDKTKKTGADKKVSEGKK
ncbi:MAG: Swt1 family HEPN domain-containing protein [Methanimicrococcus sp.]|nr:Swt1 family HEPN domain-containing protein [Methanimicrococcus sp.]